MSLNAITHSWNVLRGSQTNNTYSDLSLSTVRGETINCHKVVICNVSDKVRGALEKKDTNNLVIRNVTYSGLKNVINFIYYGKVEISDAEQLIDFADTFTILQINLGPKIASTVRNIIMSNDVSDTEEQIAQGYKCENCDKNFVTKKKLSRQVREVHEKVQMKVSTKPAYSCETCGAIYTVII